MSLSLFLPRDLLQAHQLVQGGVPLEGQSPLGGQEVDSDKGEFGDAHMQPPHKLVSVLVWYRDYPQTLIHSHLPSLFPQTFHLSRDQFTSEAVGKQCRKHVEVLHWR